MDSPAVTIIDYGAGNICSVLGAFSAIGARCSIESDPDRIRESRIVVLPGVGSFQTAMSQLKVNGATTALKEAIASGSKVLGICLGMQLLAEWSDEESGSPGLGVVRGTCRRFIQSELLNLRVPHMGFNSVRAPSDSILFQGIPPEGDFYFAHSYRMDVQETRGGETVATTDHGGRFVSAYEVGGSVFGVQFHPELSQGSGLRLLANFVRHAAC